MLPITEPGGTCPVTTTSSRSSDCWVSSLPCAVVSVLWAAFESVESWSIESARTSVSTRGACVDGPFDGAMIVLNEVVEISAATNDERPHRDPSLPGNLNARQLAALTPRYILSSKPTRDE